MAGKPATDRVFTQAGQESSQVLNPQSDVNGDPEYRRDLLRTLVGRALTEAAARTC